MATPFNLPSCLHLCLLSDSKSVKKRSAKQNQNTPGQLWNADFLKHIAFWLI